MIKCSLARKHQITTVTPAVVRRSAKRLPQYTIHLLELLAFSAETPSTQAPARHANCFEQHTCSAAPKLCLHTAVGVARMVGTTYSAVLVGQLPPTMISRPVITQKFVSTIALCRHQNQPCAAMKLP